MASAGASGQRSVDAWRDTAEAVRISPGAEFALADRAFFRPVKVTMRVEDWPFVDGTMANSRRHGTHEPNGVAIAQFLAERIGDSS